MRWACLLAAAVLPPAATVTRRHGRPRPRPRASDPGPRRSARPPRPRGRRRRPGGARPLRCPASSSRAGWGSRVRALGGGDFVKLNGRRPRLAMVDADGRVLRRIELGARPTTYTRVLACGHRGRVAAAWLERRDEFMTLRLSMGGEARTVDTEHAPYDYGEMSGVALAFFPDGSLLVGLRRLPRGAGRDPSRPTVPSARRSGSGPASEVTQIAAEIGRRGRAVVGLGRRSTRGRGAQRAPARLRRHASSGARPASIDRSSCVRARFLRHAASTGSRPARRRSGSPSRRTAARC